MAVSYVNRKCASCGGRKFEYVQKSKTWTCLYCGTTTERQENYDGLFTIKNVIRQALEDISLRRMDSAEKNLVECEKIDSKYVGTLIVNLSYYMIKATLPGTSDPQTVRNYIAKIKRYHEQIQSEHPVITDEEEILYEFFESSNIYATLLLVFDALNDRKRCAYLEPLLAYPDIDSKETIKNLLSYSLKNQRLPMFDAAVKNGNADLRFALSEIFSKYPDGERKASHISNLMERGAFSKEDKIQIEQYLIQSPDSMGTKYHTYCSVVKAGIKLTSSVIFETLLEKLTDMNQAISVMDQFCSTPLTDDDRYAFIEYCIHSSRPERAVMGLEILKKASHFVTIDSRHLVSLLSRKNLSAGTRLDILKKLYAFNVEYKQREAVVNHYLCFNQDDWATRNSLLPFLLETIKSVPTSSIENYLLKNSGDGSNKAQVIQQIMDKDINLSYFHDLLAKYLNSSIDQPTTKDEIVSILIRKGLTIDAKSFSDYICNSSENTQTKTKYGAMLLANGSRLANDALNKYLMSLIGGQQFDPDLFALLLNDSQMLTENALRHYLLYCKDREIAKVRNFDTFSSKMATPYVASMCSIKHLGNSISCNLAQAYLLVTNDSYEVSHEIMKRMLAEKVKINAEMRIDSTGKTEKLKKYVLANKDQLGTVTAALCDAFKVYSMLF